MQSCAVIFLLLAPAVIAKMCYSGQRSSSMFMNNNMMMQNNPNMMNNNNMNMMQNNPNMMSNNNMMMQTPVVQQCPLDAMYCYKAYSESRDLNGQKSWVESRSCGTPTVCQREGCWGDNENRSCCCRNDLCNSADSKTVFIGSVATVLLYFIPAFQ